MEYGYSILMFIFSVALLLYGLLALLTGDILLVPKYWTARITDKKRYAKQFGKVIMIISSAPFLSAIAGLPGGKWVILAVILLIGGVAGGIVIGTRIMPKEDEED